MNKSQSLFTVAMMSIAILVFSMVVLVEEYLSWNHRVEQLNGDLTQAARSVIQHLDDTVEMVHSNLDALRTQIRDAEIDGHGSDRLLAQMKSLEKLSDQVDAFSFIGPDGRIIATTRTGYDPTLNLADRDYFKALRDGAGTSIRIDHPIKSRLGGGWILPIATRYDRVDGTFGGVIVAEVPVLYLNRFLSQFDVGARGVSNLILPDGIAVTRNSSSETTFNLDFSRRDLFTKWLPKAASGSYEFVSMVDGEHRVGSYAQSHTSGLVAHLAFSRSEAFSQWLKEGLIRWSVVVVCIAFGLFAFQRWLRESHFRFRREKELAAREMEFRLLAESSTDLIQRINENGEIQYASPASRDILGEDPEALLGRNIAEGLDEENSYHIRDALGQLQQADSKVKVVLHRTLGSGRAVWLDVGLSRMPSSPGGKSHVVAISRDISHHKAELDELDRLAHTDPLTGLANRRYFNRKILELTGGTAGEQDIRLSLLIIDVDRFKYYNDTYGHPAGDGCLKAIAQCVKESLRRSDDIAARYGGEELAVLLPGAGAEDAMRIAERIRGRIAAARIEHEQNGPWGIATVSIGVATLSHHVADKVEDIIERADKALYGAKETGRNRVLLAGSETGRDRVSGPILRLAT